MKTSSTILTIVVNLQPLEIISSGFLFNINMVVEMALAAHEIDKAIVDLFYFFYEHPRHKLPMRYIWLLTKIVQNQLDGHPAVTNDIKEMVVIDPSAKPLKSKSGY